MGQIGQFEPKTDQLRQRVETRSPSQFGVIDVIASRIHQQKMNNIERSQSHTTSSSLLSDPLSSHPYPISEVRLLVVQLRALILC